MKVLFFTHGYHSLCSIKAQIASYGPTWAAPALCTCDAPGVPCSPGSANPRTGECGDYIRKHPTQTRPDGPGRIAHRHSERSGNSAGEAAAGRLTVQFRTGASRGGSSQRLRMTGGGA